jgi:hypothetical protein
LTEGLFNSPHGIAVDALGRAHVVEWVLDGRHLRLNAAPRTPEAVPPNPGRTRRAVSSERRPHDESPVLSTNASCATAPTTAPAELNIRGAGGVWVKSGLLEPFRPGPAMGEYRYGDTPGDGALAALTAFAPRFQARWQLTIWIRGGAQ